MELEQIATVIKEATKEKLDSWSEVTWGYTKPIIECLLNALEKNGLPKELFPLLDYALEWWDDTIAWADFILEESKTKAQAEQAWEIRYMDFQKKKALEVAEDSILTSEEEGHDECYYCGKAGDYSIYDDTEEKFVHSCFECFKHNLEEISIFYPRKGESV